MQRTFGGDKRFDLDSRFLESEEDDEDDDDDHAQKETAMDDADESFSTHEEDDIIGNLKQEKEMAMKVLSSILGGDFRAEFGHGEKQEKVPEFRYLLPVFVKEAFFKKQSQRKPQSRTQSPQAFWSAGETLENN